MPKHDFDMVDSQGHVMECTKCGRHICFDGDEGVKRDWDDAQDEDCKVRATLNSIRVVKPVAPIRLNNHWVYRVDDTKEVGVDEFIEWADKSFIPLEEGTPKRIVELFMEYVILGGYIANV